jgi:hypothetical protein
MMGGYVSGACSCKRALVFLRTYVACGKWLWFGYALTVFRGDRDLETIRTKARLEQLIKGDP